MAASRLFSKISDDHLISVSEEHENENTRMKIKNMLKDAAFATHINSLMFFTFL